jgi:hypothetical protein
VRVFWWWVGGMGRGSRRTPLGRRSSGMGGSWGRAWCTVGPLQPRIKFGGRGVTISSSVRAMSQSNLENFM